MSISRQPVVVQVDTYTCSYSRISPDLIYLERTIHRRDVDHQIDAFGQSWVLAWGDLKPGTVSVLRGGAFLPLVGKVLIFLPPFSIVHWRVSPGTFSFESLLSKSPLPPDLPQQSIVWRGELAGLPRSVDEVMEVVRGASEVSFIAREEAPFGVARRVKSALDACYTEATPMGEIARRLRLNPAVMSRNFKHCYGITPVQYRNNMRIMDSLEVLVDRNPVVAAGHSVGFEDVSQFNKLFRRCTKAVPSQFNASKLGRTRS